jgi:hypothetical protein
VRDSAFNSAASSAISSAAVIPYVTGRDAVAERFLVAVRQRRVVVAGSHDPLEAGERLGVRMPALRADGAEQRRRNDRRGIPPGPTAPHQMVGQQDADVVAAKHAPAGVRASIGHRHRTSVSVGVIRDSDVGAGLLGECDDEVDGAGLLRIRE